MKLSLSFLSSRFFYMTKRSGQKFKYLEDEKTFKDEIKCIFHDFKGLSLKQIKQIFLKGERRTLRKNGSRKIPPGKIPTQKIPTHQTLHWKTPPGIFPPGIVPPFSLIAFLHLTLLFDLFTNVKVRKTKLWGLEELKMLFRNVEEKI